MSKKVTKPQVTKNYYPMTKPMTGLLCLSCGRVVLSFYRHDCKFCGCENALMLDGGGDYARMSAVDLTLMQRVKVTPLKPKKAKK